MIRVSGDKQDFMALVKATVAGKIASVQEIIERSPDLVRQAARVGASRQTASQYFFPEIRHYL